jgi:uncharacterized coiled-coil protein SlyX
MAKAIGLEGAKTEEEKFVKSVMSYTAQLKKACTDCKSWQDLCNENKQWEELAKRYLNERDHAVGQVVVLQQHMAELQHYVAELHQHVAEFQQHVAELTARLQERDEAATKDDAAVEPKN